MHAPRSTSALWQRLRQQDGLRSVAVMGMAKNTGKTVTLNHLLAAAAADGVRVGVTSIGRDGEARDAVFDFPKPPVSVWPGTLVATARGTLQRAGVRTRPIDGTGIASPMGEIVIVQVLQAGSMEVAGASRSLDQRRVVARLAQCGATLTLLDGALGRSPHASPAVADAVVLATGAALGGGIADVLRKTGGRLDLLGIEAADATTAARCAALFESGGVALWDRAGGTLHRASVASLNAGPALLAASRGFGAGAIGTVACSGAVGRSLWQAFEALATDNPGLAVVVADGTRLFIEAAALAGLTRRGARLLAWRPIRIAGLTLNPFSPEGAHFDAAAFAAAARAAWPQHLVCDVQHAATTSDPSTESTHGSLAA